MMDIWSIVLIIALLIGLFLAIIWAGVMLGKGLH